MSIDLKSIMKIIIIFILYFVCDIDTKILPDYIPICTRKVPDYGKCVQKAIQKLRPYFVNGIPKLRVPSNAPLLIPQIKIERYQDLFVMRINVNNLRVYGLNGIKYKYLRINLDDNKYEADVQMTYPNLRMTCEYDVAGSFISIPVFGQGTFDGNCTDTTVKGNVHSKVVVINGTEYLQMDKIKLNIFTNDAHIKLIDNGPNALIAETATNLINENMRLALDVFRPLSEETNEIIAKAIGNRILGRIPLSELIPDE